MTDKGPYHSYDRGTVPSEDLPVTTHTGTALTVARGGEGRLPALLTPDPAAERRVIAFFTAHIRNPHTRKAYAWAERFGIAHLRQVEPVHVAAYVEELQGRMAAPSVKLHLAGIRMLFDWLVVGQVLPTNPASAVRGPKHSVKKGKTPVLTTAEALNLLDSIVPDTLPGLRDRALIALMIYTFARVGAVLKMRTEDVFIQDHRTWVRLREKGGQRHEMPCHHKLEAYLQDYAAALPASPPPDPKAWLFPTALGPSGHLSNRPMSQADVYRMIPRRAADAGIETQIGCHSFRATGI